MCHSPHSENRGVNDSQQLKQEIKYQNSICLFGPSEEFRQEFRKLVMYEKNNWQNAEPL